MTYLDETKEQVVQAFLSQPEATQDEIAQQFNVSKTSMRRWVKDVDPEAYRLSIGKTRQLLQAQELVANSDRLYVSEIARLVGVSQPSVSRWKKLGLLDVNTECIVCGEETTTKYCKSCRQNKYDYYHRSYGLTYTQILNLPKACEICGVEQDKMHVDHDHSTGEYRGVLCSNCNTGIGKLGDSIEGLQRAIEYLKEKGSGIS